MFSSVASAKTEYYPMENNTGLNFMNGYYLIEVINVDKVGGFATVNLTSDGKSNKYNVWDGESASINTAPWNKIQNLNGSFFTTSGFRMGIDYPSNWSAPVKYTISVPATAVAIDATKVPNIALTKSVDKTNVNLGDVVEFKLTVENTGNGTATNITLEEYLPSSFTRATGTTFPPKIKESLEPGQIDTIVYGLKAVESGTFNIEPAIVSYGSKNSKSNPVTITVAKEVKEMSKLTTAITLDDYDVMTGDLINLVVKITNEGNVSAESVLVEGSVPEGFEVDEGDLRQVYKKIEAGESESYSAILKAVDGGNYTIRLKTSYNDDTVGFSTSSESISVTKKEKNPVDYWYIIIPVIGIIIGVLLFTMRKHKEYSY